MQKAIISLTTISSRIGRIHNVIESLLSQNCNLSYHVELYISKEAYLLDEGILDIPEELLHLERESDNKFKIFFTENIGPYRKFIPVLSKYFKDEIEFDYLVTVDDDTVYPNSWLSGLVEGIEKFDCVVAYRGRTIRCDRNTIAPYRKWHHSCDSLLLPDIKTVGTGKDGIIYKPSFFHPDIIDYRAALNTCNHADDLWLKMYSSINGVPTVLLSESLNEAFVDIGGEDGNTLYRKINKHGGNDDAVAGLIKYFLKRYELNLLDVFNLNCSLDSSWGNPKFLNSYLN